MRRGAPSAWLALAALVAGCGDSTPAPQPIVGSAFDAGLLQARRRGLPVAVLVFDPGRGDADRAARTAFELSTAGAVPVELDLTSSRNRADAAPLHGLEAPTLVCLSSHGVICSRDDRDITGERVRRQIAQAAGQGPQLDAELDRLSAAAEAHPDDVTPRMALAGFLLSHHNDREAIPHLRRVAADASADVDVRVRAWVALGRSHLWMVEPEKARHAAQALMATLGPRSAEAMAGGNLVRGLQDIKAKRFDRARDELAAAATVAPASDYGREATGLLATLPTVPGR